MDQSFDALIVNGQLVPAENLREFEGRQVHVTVSLAPDVAKQSSEGVDDESSVGLDVEKDVYAPIPWPRTMISNPIIVSGSVLKPCLILPQELCDE